ncbi:MAG: thymidine kinase, partial [Clostridia bacterium]|nr:thymidine kinase [Clostridia bacterium]
MGKLHFRYGVVNSSLTATALMFRHGYEQKNMQTIVFKPAIDTKHGKDGIVEEMGISAPCIDFNRDDNLFNLFETAKEDKKIQVVIVVECQFCTKEQVEQLREISDEVSVYAYGLMTNFRTELFEGSKRFLEISDSIQ